MSRGYRLFFATAFGCIILAVALGLWLQPEKPNLPGEKGFQEQSHTYQAGGANCQPAKISVLPIRLRQRKADACAEAEQQHRESANGIVEARRAASAADAQAISANQQARIATWGGIVGALTLFAAIGAAVFAERAAFQTKRSADAAFEAVKEAEKGAKASQDALDEARRMNAASVRPHVAIESAVIHFSADDLCPEITLTTRNTGDFTAHDWEWQPLLKYGPHGSPGQRKTPVHRWGQRGVAGVDLPRGDQSPRIPVRLGGFELNLAESAAATALTIAEGLHVHLTVFSRCYDTFGNSVDDTHHFTRVVFNLMEWLEPGWANLSLQRTPPGTRIEGDEDRIPT